MTIKKNLFQLVFLLTAFHSYSQNVGIGTNTPQSRLHIISPGNEVARLDANNPFLSLYTNGVYKGYFWKSPNSIEIGSASGSGLPVTLAPDGYQRVFVTHAGNVGIGIGSPGARLHVADSSVLFSAMGDIPATPGNIPVSGDGRRMMWYADKAAFRAGYVYGGRWNKDSVGDYSIALGLDTKAKGNASVALGYYTTAEELASTAIGISTRAGGFASTAMGNASMATGDFSTAMGYQTIASGIVSTAMGESTMAVGGGSTAMGFTTFAQGVFSTSIGIGTTAKAVAGFSAGIYNDYTDNPDPETAAPTDRIFQIGNGDDVTRSNAMTVLRNGNTGIGIVNPNAALQFANDIRNRKIVLWESANNDHEFFGFGINGSALRYQTSSHGADHVFYSAFGASGSTELLRIKGNGNVGIGFADPAYKLDVGGRMRMRSSGGNSAGIWFTNSANNLLPAFVGMRNDNLVGFYGTTAPNNGWSFLMNTANGKIGIGTDDPAAQLEVNGYTKLGSDAPSIKIKKLTGTTAPNENGYIEISHGVSAGKILSVSVLVKSSGYNHWYGPNTGGFGVNYYCYEAGSAILISNRFGDSAAILSQPIKILIVYEE